VIQEQCFDGCELIDDPAALIYAKGNYLLFWDENVLPEPCFVGKMYALAEKTQADITICDYWTINAAGEKRREAGIKKNWLRSCAQVFNRKDCPDHILQIAPSVLGNRMYRAAFIREWISRWDYPAVFDVLTFGAVSLAAADSIAWLEDALITDYGQNRTGTETLWDRLEQSVEKIEGLKLADEIENSVIKLLVGTAVAVLKNGIADFSSQSAAELYERTHREFNGPRLKDINPANLYNAQLFREFRTVQKHDYQTMKCMVSRELVVSVTSFPARIGLLAQSLESVYAQSRKPDRVVLWLARDQFPGGQEDLPQSLVDLIAQGKLELFWCSDLRGHKKYLGSFRKYPDGLIVTVDDDLIYPRDMLECLWKSYLLYPNAVSALRTHLMLLSESGKILPYQSWIMETDACIHQPSMQLMATGGAGTLYPPELFRPEIFREEAIRETCLNADDLWLKAMELISDIPTVLCRPFERLRFVPGSQEEALHTLNVGQNQNDVQLRAISKWLDAHVGANILVEKLTRTSIGTVIHGTAAVSHHLDQERKSHRWRKLQLDQGLKDAKAELKKTEDALKHAKADMDRCLHREELLRTQLQDAQNRSRDLEEQLRGREADLRRAEENWNALNASYCRTTEDLEKTRGMLTETREKLRWTQEDLRWIREHFPIARQLRDLGQMLQEQKKTDRPIAWGAKYLIYLFAWIPEKLLAGAMYCLKNGMKQTIKKIFGK